MISTIEEFQACAQVFFKLHPQERKYESPETIKAIVGRMRSYGLSVPSDTMVFRALSELVSEGIIGRVDDGNERTDRLAVEKANRDRIDRLASQPLTNTDFENYGRMTPDEVEKSFYSDPVFAARYTRAANTWGFKIPPKPAPSAEVPVEQDSSQWRTLDAKTYHSMQTSRIIQLYRSDAGFKRAVDRLIKTDQI